MALNADERAARARAFYGESYEHAPHKAILDSAVGQLEMAVNASTPGIQDRALNLAAANELKAFAA